MTRFFEPTVAVDDAIEQNAVIRRQCLECGTWLAWLPKEYLAHDIHLCRMCDPENGK
jgi:hypothetical protein